jgi:hypothetical protein
MENIVRLCDYRKRKPAPRPASAPGTQYFCTRCDSGVFRLSAGGMIHCAHCAALIRNLLVTPSSCPAA